MVVQANPFPSPEFFKASSLAMEYQQRKMHEELMKKQAQPFFGKVPDDVMKRCTFRCTSPFFPSFSWSQKRYLKCIICFAFMMIV